MNHSAIGLRILPSMRRPLLMLLGVALAACSGATPASSATLPPQFEDAVVADDVAGPTALAFTPDGRMLITTQGGLLRVVQNGTLRPDPALDLGPRICSDFERGLLGVAVDPAFSSNRRIFLYYTAKNTAGACPQRPTDGDVPMNRVSSFVLSDANTVDPASEVPLITNIRSFAGNHNGGDLQFGRDGLLYVSVGDAGCDYLSRDNCGGANDAARDPNVLLGKILRVTPDGGIPAGNPYRGTGSARCNRFDAPAGTRCQETFAGGLRNPFRMAFDPNAAGTRFFINDVGQNAWEEIDEGRPGADYGWNAREGHCATGSTTNCGPTGFDNPVFDYPHSSGCRSITGGAFVPNGIWPREFDGSYLYADYVCGKIVRLSPQAGGGLSSQDFVTDLGNSSAVALAFGPHAGGQALYYTTYTNGGDVRRISFTGTANRTPSAGAIASPSFGETPLTVSFDASASADPDGDALTYLWDFGDGMGTETTSSATTHTYLTRATYTAVLRVRDARGAVSGPTTVRIDAGNSPPVPVIDAPAAGARFRVGQRLTLRGHATDPQDGAVPASRLSWTVLLHHDNDHTHPLVPPTGGKAVTLKGPAPEDLPAAKRSYLELRLTATDASGLSTTVSKRLQPRRVALRLRTAPRGLRLRAGGVRLRGPRTITSWAGYRVRLEARPQTARGRRWRFRSWSHRRTARHTLVTPARDRTYTARFRAVRRR